MCSVWLAHNKIHCPNKELHYCITHNRHKRTGLYKAGEELFFIDPVGLDSILYLDIKFLEGPLQLDLDLIQSTLRTTSLVPSPRPRFPWLASDEKLGMGLGMRLTHYM